MYQFSLEDLKLEEGYNEYFIGLLFTNESINKKRFYDTTININAIPKEDYYAMQREKVTIFIALLSLIVFSLFAGIKNLKDLIEK